MSVTQLSEFSGKGLFILDILISTLAQQISLFMTDIKFNPPYNFFYTAQIDDLNINSDELLKASGDTNVCLNEYFNEIAEGAIKYAKRNATIKADFSIKPIRLIDDIVYCNNKKLNIGSKMASIYENSEWAIFFVATAGYCFEKESAYLANNGMQLESYYLDLLGSMVVEQSMDLFQSKLSDFVNKFNLKTTNRYSPGYCEWKIDEQFALFKLVDENKADISLNSNALMSPLKSVSGMIGVGRDVKFNKHECDLCNSYSCIYRKTN